MLKLSGFMFAACLAVVGLAAPAVAVPITWTLHDVEFDDGATASGSFVYDADTNTISGVNIVTTDGLADTGAIYTLNDPGFGPFPDIFVAVTGVLADYTGTPALALAFIPPLSNAGGLAMLDTLGGGEFDCIDAGCTNGDLVRGFVSGFVTATGVPEPATVSLLLAGLAGYGAMRLRRRRAA